MLLKFQLPKFFSILHIQYLEIFVTIVVKKALLFISTYQITVIWFMGINISRHLKDSVFTRISTNEKPKHIFTIEVMFHRIYTLIVFEYRVILETQQVALQLKYHMKFNKNPFDK